MRREKIIRLALDQATKRNRFTGRIKAQARAIAKHGTLSLKAKDRLQALIRSDAARFGEYSFTWEVRACGKPGCTRCPHGPYLYARRDRARIYIGR